MSNISVIKTTNFESNFEPSISFYEKAAQILFSKVADFEYGSEPKDCDDKNFINDETFNFFWNLNPGARIGMIKQLISCSNETNHRSYWREPRYSLEFSKSKLSELYEAISSSSNSSDVRAKISIIQALSLDFDWLEVCHKYFLKAESGVEDDLRIYDMYKSAALKLSNDPGLYDFVYSKIKREKGAVKDKAYVVQCAIENNALSETLLSICAKKGTKNIKRTAVNFIQAKMNSAKNDLARAERQGNEALQNSYEEKVDDMERKLMLFVDCDDAEVVSSLMESLSRNNLPWLMPAASKHNWLSNRLQRIIDSGGQCRY